MKEIVKKFKTPKLTLDWYIKWASSLIILVAMSLRSSGEFPFADMCLSFVGCAGWIAMGVIWKDRAILILNSVACFILLTGIIKSLAGA
jgi:hypothetical protein|tara:strand:+ start:121 stop:387 length:267 start_codon:yes stop_codon:yes gene_type:complete